MKKLLKSMAALTLCLSMTACSKEESSGLGENNDWPEELVLIQMPNENNPNAGTVHAEFSQALSEYLGIPVKEMEGGDYTASIEGMAAKNIDVTLVSPMSYFQAKERAGAELLVSTPMSDYRTVFITKADRDDINSLEDLKGKSFAFVDQASSSGYLWPKTTLVKELKLDPDQLETSGYYFDTVAFSGSHPTTAMGVAMGDYDAGAVAGMMVDGLVQAGQLKENELKVIAQTDTIPNPSYVVREDLPQDLKDKIKEFFLTYDNADYFKEIHGDENIRFVDVDESIYDSVKEMLDLLHLDLGE